MAVASASIPYFRRVYFLEDDSSPERVESRIAMPQLLQQPYFPGAAAANSDPTNLAALIADLSQAPIDWDTAPAALSTGSLVGMPDEFVLLVDMLVRNEALVEIATRLGLDPIALAIGLLARAQARHSRTAARIASALLPPGVDADLP